MPTVTYNVYEEEKGYQPKVTVNDCDETSGTMPNESFKKTSGKREIVGIVFCCFMVVGITAISALHFESQRRWYREYTDLEEKYQRLDEKRIIMEETNINETLKLRNYIDKIKREAQEDSMLLRNHAELIKNEARADTLQLRNDTELIKKEARAEALELRDYVEQVKRKAQYDTLQLRNDTELIKNEAQAERHQTALALNSMNESIRSRLLQLNADISEFVSSQDHQNTYIDLILLKLLGWEKSEHVVYKYFRQAVNYGTAQARCAGYPSGRLAAKALRDPAFVSNIIAKGYVGSSDSSIQKPWIGYDDGRTEGVWIWSDGGAMNPQTTKWPSPQPDDAGGVEDCGQIWQAGSGKIFLNDNRCDRGFYYICEVDI